MSRTLLRETLGFISRRRRASAVSRWRWRTSRWWEDGRRAWARARPGAVWHSPARRAITLSYSRVWRDFAGVVIWGWVLVPGTSVAERAGCFRGVGAQQTKPPLRSLRADFE